MESPIKTICLTTADFMREAHIIRYEVLYEDTNRINKIFTEGRNKPLYPFQIVISDYPDIASLHLEPRHYTEQCDDIEGYFRANLYYLIHLSDDILSKYKFKRQMDNIQSAIYFYTAPIILLSERISVSIKIPATQCFRKALRIMLIFRIFYHHFYNLINDVRKYDSLSCPMADSEIEYLLKTLSHTFTYRHIMKEVSTMAVFVKLTEKAFRHLPLVLLKNIQEEQILEKLNECVNEETCILSVLMHKLGIEEYLLFKKQLNN